MLQLVEGPTSNDLALKFHDLSPRHWSPASLARPLPLFLSLPFPRYFISLINEPTLSGINAVLGMVPKKENRTTVQYEVGLFESAKWHQQLGSGHTCPCAAYCTLLVPVYVTFSVWKSVPFSTFWSDGWRCPIFSHSPNPILPAVLSWTGAKWVASRIGYSRQSIDWWMAAGWGVTLHAPQ